MWFEPMMCLESTEESMTIGVPNDFASIWIHDNYLDLITQRLRLNTGSMVNVILRKTDAPAEPAKAAEQEPATTPSRTPPRRTTRYDDRGAITGTLNPRNMFENFVVGSNNQMAHAAALAVAQAPRSGLQSSFPLR